MWKKKASCNFVFFTCPCKENEIIISSEIDSSLKKLLTSRKRITSHNRGPQIIIILLKHISFFFGTWNKESVHSKVDNKENKMSLLCDSPYIIDVYIEN